MYKSFVMSAEQRFGIEVIRAAIGGEAAPPPDAGMDWAHLCDFAQQQALSPLVLRGLQFSGIQPPSQVRQRLENEAVFATAQESAQHLALQKIYEALEKRVIICVPLKGIWLRERYPEPRLRTMTDIDLWVESKNLTAVDEILRSQGYQPAISAAPSSTTNYMQGLFLFIEIHTSLLTPKEQAPLQAPLAGAFERAVPVVRYRCIRRLAPLDEAFFLWAHFYKHYQKQGTGLRPLLDIWLSEHALQRDVDKAALDRRLQAANLLAFAEQARRLAEQWFGGGPAENAAMLAELLLDSGPHGTGTQRQIRQAFAREAAFHSRAGAWFNVLLPDKESLCSRYPRLQRQPYLLPWYWLCRLCRLATDWQAWPQRLAMLRWLCSAKARRMIMYLRHDEDERR